MAGRILFASSPRPRPCYEAEVFPLFSSTVARCLRLMSLALCVHIESPSPCHQVRRFRRATGCACHSMYRTAYPATKRHAPHWTRISLLFHSGRVYASLARLRNFRSSLNLCLGESLSKSGGHVLFALYGLLSKSNGIKGSSIGFFLNSESILLECGSL